TGYGAIIGVPLIAVGATMKGVGLGVKAGGKIAPQAMKKTGEVAGQMAEKGGKWGVKAAKIGVKLGAKLGRTAVRAGRRMAIAKRKLGRSLVKGYQAVKNSKAFKAYDKFSKSRVGKAIKKHAPGMAKGGMVGMKVSAGMMVGAAGNLFKEGNEDGSASSQVDGRGKALNAASYARRAGGQTGNILNKGLLRTAFGKESAVGRYLERRRSATRKAVGNVAGKVVGGIRNKLGSKGAGKVIGNVLDKAAKGVGVLLASAMIRDKSKSKKKMSGDEKYQAALKDSTQTMQGSAFGRGVLSHAQELGQKGSGLNMVMGIAKFGMILTGMSMLVAMAAAPVAGAGVAAGGLVPTIASVAMGGYMAKKVLGATGVGRGIGNSMRESSFFQGAGAALSTSGTVKSAQAYSSLSAQQKRGFIFGKALGMGVDLGMFLAIGMPVAMAEKGVKFAMTGGLSGVADVAGLAFKAPGAAIRGVSALGQASTALLDQSGKGTAFKGMEGYSAETRAKLGGLDARQVAEAGPAAFAGASTPDRAAYDKAREKYDHSIDPKTGKERGTGAFDRLGAVGATGRKMQERLAQKEMSTSGAAGALHYSERDAVRDARLRYDKEHGEGSFDKLGAKGEMGRKKQRGLISQQQDRFKTDAVNAAISQVREDNPYFQPKNAGNRLMNATGMSYDDSQKAAAAGITAVQIASGGQGEVEGRLRDAGVSDEACKNVAKIQEESSKNLDSLFEGKGPVAAKTADTAAGAQGSSGHIDSDKEETPAEPKRHDSESEAMWYRIKEAMVFGGRKRRQKGIGEQLEEMMDDREESPQRK
ncbi:MAG: hypothetical protein KKD39_05845, partial [Candidatus Altiarchaeota archaeon]|nr:hypothetical protein [Candidatus Altiarchaeota archaeon]